MIINKEKIIEALKISFCIAIGTLVGVLSLAILYNYHIDIFGFNLGLIFSPLLAGYVETHFARKICGKTTGAVSAFILFIITVLYGFIYINTGLGLNLMTVGSATIILASAFPILGEYFLIVFVFGLLAYILKDFKKIFFYIKNTIYKSNNYENIKNIKYDSNLNHIDVNDLGILFLTTTRHEKKKILEYNGIFESSVIINNSQKFFNKSSDSEEVIDNLKKATEQAILNFSIDLKKNNCNGALDITFEYDAVGNFGDAYQIVVRGTGIRI
jgi:uncharacterized protein YbjQ (UPF0145 family)